MDTEQNFGDDQFEFDPNAYQGQNTQVLPQPGIYAVRVTSFGPKKDRKTGQPVVTPFGPVNRINRIEIVEPEGGGSHGVFKDVSPTPFKRGNAPKPNASGALDVVAAVDKSLLGQLSGWEDAGTVAEQELKAGAVIKVRLGYEAMDMEKFKQAVSTIPEGDQDARNKAWREATYRTKTFRRADGQGYNTNVTTPDGRTLSAKLVIDGFVQSDASDKVGPFFGQKRN